MGGLVMRKYHFPDTHNCTTCGLPIPATQGYYVNKNKTRRHDDGGCSMAVQTMLTDLLGVHGFDLLHAFQAGVEPREFGKELSRDMQKAKEVASFLTRDIERILRTRGLEINVWTFFMALHETAYRLRNRQLSSFARYIPLAFDPEPTPDAEAIWQQSVEWGCSVLDH